MQIFINLVENFNSPVYSAPPCIQQPSLNSAKEIPDDCNFAESLP